MKTLQPSKFSNGMADARTGNYDDYQSYIEDPTQYNKEVSSCLIIDRSDVTSDCVDGRHLRTWNGCCLSNHRAQFEWPRTVLLAAKRIAR